MQTIAKLWARTSVLMFHVKQFLPLSILAALSIAGASGWQGPILYIAGGIVNIVLILLFWIALFEWAKRDYSKRHQPSEDDREAED